MKKIFFFGIAIFILFSSLQITLAQERSFIQLKIYTIENEEQVQRLDQYLENAYIPAMHRAGIQHVGVFKPIEKDPFHNKHIFVLIPFKDLLQFEKIDRTLNDDKKYLSAGSEYINALHDDPPYVRIKSILLRTFEDMPNYGVPEHNTPSSERIYELRSYQGSTEKKYEKKLEMFNQGGEADIFVDLGFQPIFFGEVIIGPDLPNLMYLTTFSDEESQSEHWDAFRESPEWEALKLDPQYNNTVSHIDKYLLYPAEYSDL